MLPSTMLFLACLAVQALLLVTIGFAEVSVQSPGLTKTVATIWAVAAIVVLALEQLKEVCT